MLVPDSKGGRMEVAVLGRGQFVGERSVINDKLRSADCVAQGRVQVCGPASRARVAAWWLGCDAGFSRVWQPLADMGPTQSHAALAAAS